MLLNKIGRYLKKYLNASMYLVINTFIESI